MATSNCAAPLDAYDAGCRCYEAEDVKKIAEGLMRLETCEAVLIEKETLIQKRLVENQSATPSLAFWQQPSFIVGGTVVTIAVSSLFTAWILKK